MRVKKFIDVLGDAKPVEPMLPLVHTTSVPNFEYIGYENKLTKRNCDVYTSEKLVYFFYGRPSFRPPGQDEYHRFVIQYAPICLVLCNNLPFTPRRIMPFDSGAYHQGIMHREGHAHRHLLKERFEMDSMSDAARLVGLFYGSNLAYYTERHSIPTEMNPHSNMCVESYISLIGRNGTNHGDSRLNTVEIQYSDDITLLGNVLAVALPSVLLDDEEISGKLREWNAEPLAYDIDGGYRPGECCRVVENMTKDFLISNGFI